MVEDRKQNVLIIMRLTANKARDKITPILSNESLQHAWLVRLDPTAIDNDRLTQVTRAPQPEPTRPNLLAAFSQLFWYIRMGIEVARRQPIDTVIAVSLVPYGVIAWAVARLTGKRVIVSLIGTDFNEYLYHSPIRHFLRAIVRLCDAVTIFGEAGRKALIDEMGLQPERVFVMPNTVDTRKYYQDPTITPDYHLIYVGNLLPAKRVDLVLEVLHHLRQSLPEVRLLIVGDGTARAQLEALAQQLDIADRVTFWGWAATPVDLYHRARGFISLSDSEGLPMTTLEAMATGLPVFVTNVGAISRVVKHGENGYLYALPVNPAQVADDILKLLNDPAHYDRMRSNGITTAQANSYSLSTRIWHDILK